jgi:L-2-hydroxyglutarate oxidase LhgO
VIHAGIYYAGDSLKAHLCVAGKKLLYQFCEERGIAVNRCGKLIVATLDEQLRTDLPRLRNRAILNGVQDVRLLTPEEVQELEPAVTCKGALLSPSTGVFDSHSFMLGLLGDAEEHGATMALMTEVKGGSVTDSGVILSVDEFELHCEIVVNCGGLHADRVAKSMNTGWEPPKQFLAKGNYFRLQGIKNPFHKLIYPMPEPGGLGVHATIDWSGLTTRFGPDVEWIEAVSTSITDLDLEPDPSRAQAFYGEIRKYWPELPDNSLVPDYAGLRPKLYHPSLLTEGQLPPVDFIIAGPETHGVKGLFHLLGIESPGLTSSMAIADHIAELV